SLAAVVADLRKQAGLDAVNSSGSTGAGASVADELVSGRWAAPAGRADPERTTAYVPAASSSPSPASAANTLAAAALSTQPSTPAPAYFRSVAPLGVPAPEAPSHPP